VSQIRLNIPIIKTSLEKNDLGELKKIAHFLKGSSLNLRINALGEKFQLLEDGAKAALSRDELSVFVDQICSDFSVFEKEQSSYYPPHKE